MPSGWRRGAEWRCAMRWTRASRTAELTSARHSSRWKLTCGGGYDRLVVITDEQSHDRVPAPQGKGYVVNVASNQNGVGYGEWTHIDGWSEAVVEYIAELEAAEGDPAA